jgi:protein phosphatase
MGSTLSLCWFSEEMMHFAHIGDTRIYHLSKDGTLTQLTDDDTHVGWLRRTGQISELEARMHPAKNRLQKALGAGNQFVNPQVGEISCSSGDRFLICSDGITDGLSDQRIAETLKGCPKGITPAQHLASEATTSSGKDNATAVIVAVK